MFRRWSLIVSLSNSTPAFQRTRATLLFLIYSHFRRRKFGSKPVSRQATRKDSLHLRYQNAEDRLNGIVRTRGRGRPQTLDPHTIMANLLRTSAVVEHTSRCKHDLVAMKLCNESHKGRRKIKEALFIQHNDCLNRDRGVAVSDIWSNLIRHTKCCETSDPSRSTDVNPQNEGLTAILR
uniref:Uncharacterized protein n=1 Tax=Trichuris muris TaxID=70415 RepID=A0A5S6R0E3_TRIMR